MKTLYEVLNVDLSQQYTKERKLSVLSTMGLDSDLMLEVEDAVAEMDIPEDDDRYHWIQIFGRQSGADLLTIGKVQPENMLAMAGLGADDYTPLLTRAFAMVLGDPLLSSINKPQFDAAMRELLPEVAGWSDDRKEQVGGTFLAVWRACAFGGAAPSPSPSRMLLNYQQQRTDVFISCTG